MTGEPHSRQARPSPWGADPDPNPDSKPGPVPPWDFRSWPRRAQAGVVAAVVLILAGVGGNMTYQARPKPPPCNERRMDLTVKFAQRAGRVADIDLGVSKETPEVCFLGLLIDKTKGPDPFKIIDDAVRPAGWRRDSDTTWVNDDGFTVEARDETHESPDDPYPLAEYDVSLWGTAAPR